MKNLRKSLGVFLMVAVIVVSISLPSYAHKMTIEPIEPGKVTVQYDAGNAATRAEITVYNADGEVIEEGKVDQEGNFEFDQKEASYLEADDGMGHKDKWEVGKEVAATGGSKLPKIAAVVVVLAVVGFFFTKKK